MNSSPLYLDMQRQGIVALDELGGIGCGYDDSRVHDRSGNPYPNIYAVGSPTKGTHFFAGAVDINMHRTESVVDSTLNRKGQQMSKFTTVSDETERLADLIRREHPSLDTVPLEA